MGKLLELESFSQVARDGGFTHAARHLGLTASAVSKHVSALEERLGVRLFNRTTRRVALTDSGQAFFERLGPLLMELDEAERDVSASQTELAGSLRISCPMDFGLAHLAPALAQFAAQHSRVDLDLEFSDRFVNIVEEGFDLVLRIGGNQDSGLVARRLAPCRRVICASPEYLARHGVPREPRDLRNHQRIGYAYETARSWALGHQRADGVKPHARDRISVKVRHRSNNGELTRQLVLAGQGIAQLPTFLVAEDIRTRRLEILLPVQLNDVIPIQAIYPHRKHLSAKVRTLVDHLIAHCGTRPYWDENLGFEDENVC